MLFWWGNNEIIWVITDTWCLWEQSLLAARSRGCEKGEMDWFLWCYLTPYAAVCSMKGTCACACVCVCVCVIERCGRERGREEEVGQVQGCLALSYKQWPNLCFASILHCAVCRLTLLLLILGLQMPPLEVTLATGVSHYRQGWQ